MQLQYHEKLNITRRNEPMKALNLPQAFEESTDVVLLSSFCDYLNLHILIFK